MNHEETDVATEATVSESSFSFDQYVVPTDPMDEFQCESCQ